MALVQFPFIFDKLLDTKYFYFEINPIRGVIVGRFVGSSVGRLVGQLVGWSVGRLVGRLVGWLVGRSISRNQLITHHQAS